MILDSRLEIAGMTFLIFAHFVPFVANYLRRSVVSHAAQLPRLSFLFMASFSHP